MSDQAPTTPPAGDRPDQEDPVPNPHEATPVPPPQDGARPGADATVRPEQDEPNGPVEGLVASASAEVAEEAAEVTGDRDPEAEALLARMGVEEEGIEGGQLLGLVAATLASVAALAIILIFRFYIPFRTQVGERAEGQAVNYEQQDLRAEALAKLDQYTRTDSTYGLPITRAMGLVAADYGSADAAGLPSRRQQWNVLALDLGPGRAIQATPQRGELSGRGLPAGDGDEQVGVDEDVDTVELIENDGALDGDDAEAVPDDIE